jgi:hypothetical protein
VLLARVYFLVSQKNLVEMKKILVLVFGVLFGLIEAQPPTRFYTTFGGSGDDIGYSAKQTFDGQYIIVGSTTSFGSTDVYLLKVDSMGLLIWQKNIGGVNNDVGKSVVQMPDSGFVVAGFTNSFGSGGYDAYLLRTDKNGNTLWQKTFGGANWDFANDLVLTANNKIAVVGHTSSFGSGKKDGMVLLYDFAGNLIWQKFFGGFENEELRAIITGTDNSISTVGYTESAVDILGDHYFVKLNSIGNTLIERSFGNIGKSYLNDLIQFPTGDYILVGGETYTNLPITQSYRANLDSNVMTLKWDGNSFTYSDDENWNSVAKSISGSSRTSTVRNFYKSGFGKQGNIFSNSWNQFYPSIVNEFGGSMDENVYSVEATNDGGFICVGSTLSFESQGKDVFFIKLDSAVINYSQIVSVRPKAITSQKPLIKVKESTIEIDFDAQRILKNIQIYTFDGNIFKTIDFPTEVIELDRQMFNSSIYFFKFNYQDNQSYLTKILVM